MKLKLAISVLSLVLLSSCNRGMTVVGPPGDRLYEEKPVDLSAFREKGEKYTRREGDLEDENSFSPAKGESYELYRQRMAHTLRMQEQEIQDLEAQIQVKRDSVSNLEEQVTAASQHQNELRIALSNPGFQGDQALVQGPIIPFKRYEIQKGDTLQSIAFDQYGTHTAWLGLYRLNHKLLPNGPNQIEEGMTIILPTARR